MTLLIVRFYFRNSDVSNALARSFRNYDMTLDLHADSLANGFLAVRGRGLCSPKSMVYYGGSKFYGKIRCLLLLF